MIRRRTSIAPLLSSGLGAACCLLLLLPLAGCPDSPTAAKKVQSVAKVPGLDEAVLAKDRTIKAVIQLSWSSDPELVQEQLEVEDVHAGKVTITGIVSRPELRDRAEKYVRDEEGVVDVLNKIQVDEKLKDKRINPDDF